MTLLFPSLRRLKPFLAFTQLVLVHSLAGSNMALQLCVCTKHGFSTKVTVCELLSRTFSFAFSAAIICSCLRRPHTKVDKAYHTLASQEQVNPYSRTGSHAMAPGGPQRSA